jgi:hypothetical protein
MSSRFVSAGAIDAATGEATTAFSPSSSSSALPPSSSSSTAAPAPPKTSRRQQEWAEVTAKLEADRRRREEARQAQHAAGPGQQGEKSLYEVLQANKAAKQAAFEEAHRLRNQFRALDDDEVDFLDEVRMRKRREEEEARREVERGLAEFRRKAQSAAKGEGQGLGEGEGDDDQLGDGEVLGLEVDFAGRRKRRKGENGRDKKRVKGVGVVKRRESGEDDGDHKAKRGENAGERGGVTRGEQAPGKEELKSATSKPSTAPAQAPPCPAPDTSTAKSGGLLVDYGSDDDD